MLKAPAAVLCALLLVALTACGSGKSGNKDKVTLSKDEQAVATTIAKAFTAQSSGQLTATEATCFSRSFVDKVGLAKLKSAKLITADGKLNQSGATFDAEISGKFADAFLSCVDYQKRQAEELAKSDKTLDEKLLESCLREQMPNSYVKKLIVASQTQAADSTQLGEESNTKLTTCKTKAAKK